jgi:ADP-ribosyl-[dinitrogen reductase] hydrolase
MAGVPFEFGPRRSVHSPDPSITFQRLSEAIRAQPQPHDDDAAQTLILSEQIAMRGGVFPDRIADDLVHWMRLNGKGIGIQTSAVLRQILAGASWEDASRSVWERSGRQAAGNGSLMRFVPVALLDHACALSRLEQDCRAASRITHWDPRCEWSCFAASVFTGSLDRKPAHDALADAIAAVEQHDKDVAFALRGVVDSPREIVSGGFVLETLAASCYCVVKSEDFAGSIVKAVSLGGDADTAGTVVGAMAGFRSGLEGIPEAWSGPLADRSDGLAMICRLADSLFELNRARRGS